MVLLDKSSCFLREEKGVEEEGGGGGEGEDEEEGERDRDREKKKKEEERWRRGGREGGKREKETDDGRRIKRGRRFLLSVCLSIG